MANEGEWIGCERRQWYETKVFWDGIAEGGGEERGGKKNSLMAKIGRAHV